MVGTTDPSNFTLETVDYNSNSTFTNISLANDNVIQVDATYITNELNVTKIKQLVLKLSGGSIVEWPLTNETDFGGTQNSTMVLTG